MGRLSGFRYRDIVRRLRAFGFAFHRQAAGSHEIWRNATTGRFTTIPNHSGDMPEAPFARFCGRLASSRMFF